MPGPPPKRADLRQRRNKRADVGELRALPGDRNVPVPPPELLKVTRDRWTAFWTGDLAALVKPSDHPAVERLHQLYDERERAYREYRKHRLVWGPNGQRVVNPIYRVITTCDAEIRALEDRLGLTPMARLRLGVTFADAQRSLDDVNRALDHDEDDDDDPRLSGPDPRVVDGTATDTG